jgi:subtilisin family serine protease
VKAIGCFLITLLALSTGITSAQAEPDDPYFSSAGSWEQDFDDHWALKNLRVYTDIARTVQPEEDDAQAVVVAVIDTGMDYLHNDFAAEQLWRNPIEKRNGRDDDDNGFVDDLIGWNFVDGNNNPWDRSGHGTHISGIIAACTDNGLGITAVNADAVIMPLKVANFAGQARSSAVAAAIYYAVDNGARVINLSLGGELITELERTAARYAADNNVLIVVSAGNRGLSAAYLGYASLPDVLVVGASDLNGERAGFSNFGSPVALLAPGVEVLSLRARDSDFIALSNPPDYPPGSAIVGDDEEYYRASGTSFSAAFVSGAASRLFTLRPELTAMEAHRMLVQSAVDIGAAGVDQISGYGRVDFVRALAADPDTFVAARLLGVNLELSEQKILLNVQGTAAADQFTSAELTVRAAAGSVPVSEPEPRSKKSRKRQKEQPAADTPSPYDWQPLVAALTAPVEQGLLATVDMDSLVAMTGGSTSWELRLLVSSGDGNTRESRLSMALPVPPPITDPTADGDSDGE